MIPSATVTVLPPASPDPTRKRVRITVSPAGHYLVRGWFPDVVSGPSTPGNSFYAATNDLGVRDVDVVNAAAFGSRCLVSVIGRIASSGAASGLQVLPLSWSFGPVEPGSYLDKVFTVTNAGVSVISGTASVSAPYSIQGTASYELDPGDSASVTVRFAPSATGDFAANISFSGGGGVLRPVTGSGASAIAGTWVFYAASDSVLDSDASFAAWAGALSSGKAANPLEGGSYTLLVAPPPDVTNLVIAYPAVLRALYSVVQHGTGAQVRQSWTSGTYNVFSLGGVPYRVYQNTTLFPWTQPETFTVTL